jgi:hypothetical protein
MITLSVITLTVTTVIQIKCHLYGRVRLASSGYKKTLAQGVVSLLFKRVKMKMKGWVGLGKLR